ncbi:hypothetical protein ARMSODRAFT_1024717 [Armillaria solidipes]|uniref:Uncharacterized protein n=1 Tax=Armillaria solidipes TaxID=1076256 RepID=A0A2H3BHG7_9AGAR|nr:hypothetical protein ARMSODRAFT_1024717 [Armillaria solidipes]
MRPLQYLSVLVDEIQMITTGCVGEIVISLPHLYHQASIRKVYLEGVNDIIYEMLSYVFTVSLVLVRYLKTVNGWGKKWLTKRQDVRHTVKISSVEYIEHTGNNVQEAGCNYFGGGMFLWAKSLEV